MNQNNNEIPQQRLDVFEEGSVSCEGCTDDNAEGIGGERPSQRDGPATAKQLRFLEKLGVEAAPNLTKKEASLLIDNALLRRVS